MTVEELIEALKKFRLDAIVYLEMSNPDKNYVKLDCVTYRSKEKEAILHG